MAKHKIRKNLTDAEMFAGFQETETYEEQMLRKDEGRTVQAAPQSKKKPTGKSQDEFYREFLTETIETQIGQALLAIKLEYMKDGMDFSVQVKREGRNIHLVTAPKEIKR